MKPADLELTEILPSQFHIPGIKSGFTVSSLILFLLNKLSYFVSKL